MDEFWITGAGSKVEERAPGVSGVGVPRSLYFSAMSSHSSLLGMEWFWSSTRVDPVPLASEPRERNGIGNVDPVRRPRSGIPDVSRGEGLCRPRKPTRGCTGSTRASGRGVVMDVEDDVEQFTEWRALFRL